MATAGPFDVHCCALNEEPLTVVVVVGLNSNRGALATPGPSLERQLHPRNSRALRATAIGASWLDEG
ncbi:hypothetical protein K466DRAFT_271317 [Polyporus arcularius HHB13444]|uniref:Uncharacterized protein n=1 Tax=Polyporus arcularius HHB13444 TaxID=1314778 RepID=A0A5C3P2Y6_9APHY|nr:hypothetical protein K466DRAFT_271317 [Polyporus arcularius HHB13444]